MHALKYKAHTGYIPEPICLIDMCKAYFSIPQVTCNMEYLELCLRGPLYYPALWKFQNRQVSLYLLLWGKYSKIWYLCEEFFCYERSPWTSI